MTIELVDIPGFIQPESSKWKIKALQIDGCSPALAALDDWQQNREKDYKQIINVMKQVATNFRVTNPKQVKKTHSPKKHGSIYESSHQPSSPALLLRFHQRQHRRLRQRPHKRPRQSGCRVRSLRLTQEVLRIPLLPSPMTTHETSALPSEIAAILKGVPKTSQAMLDRIEKANRKLENDPEFLAEVERSKFVILVLAAMEEKKINRSELARRIGKSRQYVQKLLDEDARVSFTLKTITSILFALDKRLKLGVEDANSSDACASFPTQSKRRAHSAPMETNLTEPTRRPKPVIPSTMIMDTQKVTPSKEDEDRYSLSA